MSAARNKNLIALRSNLGLGQREMAEALGLALRSYQAIEAGESPYRTVHQLAAERIALSRAISEQEPMMAPPSVRREATELARLIANALQPAPVPALETHQLKSAVVKRWVVIRGHKTSLSLEDTFWSKLKGIASRRSLSLTDLVEQVDGERGPGNLASAVRMFVLQEIGKEVLQAKDEPEIGVTSHSENDHTKRRSQD